MARNESAWVEKASACRTSAARPRKFASLRSHAADRSEAEALLRDLAFVFRATQAVRTAITGRAER